MAPQAAQFARTVWSADGNNVVSYVFSDDRKDRWLTLIDPIEAKVKILISTTMRGFGGPGLQTLGWLPDSSAVYLVSGKTVFAHLYTSRLQAP